ncbi:family 10 glycosylhydrolase, partial [Ruminococcaceae bacterium OttesenSCG-928-N02]|nr:family 10 glycosylhydrolase [Ruminococcaceae bacterium OttesenSCG-928-N02]
MKRRKNDLTPYIILSLIALGVVVVIGVRALLGSPQAPQTSSSESAQGSSSQITSDPIQTAGEYRAMWVSYLEFEGVDFSSEASFTAAMNEMFDNCRSMGVTSVVVQVRPFGDALYPSAYFPWSHLATGTQGVSPGYDPLGIMVNLAHEKGLRFEAWVNPYRVQLTSKKPSAL